jgi:hypothetical protein
MKNSLESSRTYNRKIEIVVRGDEQYVRGETERLLNDMDLKNGYGIHCTVKPGQDYTRTDGSWVAILQHAQSCD